MAESENELALSPVPDVPIAYNSPDQILTVLGIHIIFYIISTTNIKNN